MFISRQTCCLAVVIALFLVQCACVTSSGDAQRLLKDSFWVPAQEDNLGVARWEGLNPDEDIIQSEAQIYGADMAKQTNDNEVMVESAPENEVEERRFGYGGLHMGLLAPYNLRTPRGRAARQEQERTLRMPGTKRRHGPSMGFMGSRGKRFIPGLESLLLAKYYRDAEKWKRQPHSGFHGSRG